MSISAWKSFTWASALSTKGRHDSHVEASKGAVRIMCFIWSRGTSGYQTARWISYKWTRTELPPGVAPGDSWGRRRTSFPAAVWGALEHYHGPACSVTWRALQ